MPVASDIKYSDLELCNEIHQRMQSDDLVLGMLSGEVLPRSCANVFAVMNWPDEASCYGRAGINAFGIGLYVFLDSLEKCKPLIKKAQNDFDSWVLNGGMHFPNQWNGHGGTHKIPYDYMEAKEGNDGLWVYSHLYNRWVPTTSKENHRRCYGDNGFRMEKDFRSKTVFEILKGLYYNNLKLPRVKQQEKLLKALGLPMPNDWYAVYGYKPDKPDAS